MNKYDFYKGNYIKIYFLLLLAMFVFYLFKINNGAGGDLMLRISESKYFINNINPYDVYNGTHPIIPEFGSPNAYSFVSYYLMIPFTLIQPNLFITKIIYSLLDISLLVIGIKLTDQLFDTKKYLLAPIIVFMFLISVFYWQQVSTLNYNIVSAFGILLIFYSISSGSTLRAVFGLILIGVKPSFAIPIIIYLIITTRWKILAIGGFIYFLMLSFAAYWINTNIFEIIMQLKSTQSSFSNGHTDGFFFFIKAFLWPNISLFLTGLLISTITLHWFKNKIMDPISGLIITTTLGISLFYNQVHAWIIIYPILIYAISEMYENKSKFKPVIFLSLFLIVPRLAGIFNEQHIDTYVAFHNVIRFGLLFVSAALLIGDRQNISSPKFKY